MHPSAEFIFISEVDREIRGISKLTESECISRFIKIDFLELFIKVDFLQLNIEEEKEKIVIFSLRFNIQTNLILKFS